MKTNMFRCVRLTLYLRSIQEGMTYRELTKPCQSCTRNYSTSESQKKFTVTFDNIFSESNKLRCKDGMTGGSLLNKEKFRRLDTANKAAVLVPLCTVKGQPSVIFTLRSTTLYDHKGEVSFPGGGKDESDVDLQHTALREAHEEIGLHPETIDVWGKVVDIPSKNFESLVTPFVGYCGEVDIDELNHNPHEVKEIFHCTIPHLCDRRNSGTTQFRSVYGIELNYTLPLFNGPYRIWGLTALILHLTLTNIAPGLYHQTVNHDVIELKTK